jgi:lipopolysaccharide transport system permease protein
VSARAHAQTLRDSPVHHDIKPRRGWAALELRRIWDYRELLYFLAWRDVKVRYKQTALGISWAILQPLLGMVVFSIIFGGFARMPSDGLPYPVFSYAGMLPWVFFSSAIDRSSSSIVANATLVTKVYFPRILIPCAAILACFVDFGFAAIVLVAMMAYFQIPITAAVLWLGPLLVLCSVLALAIGLWLSALHVRYRDVKYAVPFLLQLWMYSTPIVYPTAIVPEQWRGIFALNPMVGIIDGFRWAILGIGTPPGTSLILSALIVLIITLAGLQYFGRAERDFADAI